MEEVISWVLPALFGWITGYIWGMFLFGGRYKFDLVNAIVATVGTVLLIIYL